MAHPSMHPPYDTGMAAPGRWVPQRIDDMSADDRLAECESDEWPSSPSRFSAATVPHTAQSSRCEALPKAMLCDARVAAAVMQPREGSSAVEGPTGAARAMHPVRWLSGGVLLIATILLLHATPVGESQLAPAEMPVLTPASRSAGSQQKATASEVDAEHRSTGSSEGQSTRREALGLLIVFGLAEAIGHTSH